MKLYQILSAVCLFAYSFQYEEKLVFKMYSLNYTINDKYVLFNKFRLIPQRYDAFIDGNFSILEELENPLVKLVNNKNIKLLTNPFR